MGKTSAERSLLQIRKLDAADSDILAGFDCGDTDLNEFLRDDALRLQERHSATTYLAIYDGVLRGYVTLMTDAIPLETNERKKLLLTHHDHPVVPALKVARLACSKPFRDGCRGLGTALMSFAAAIAYDCSEMAGCRLITLDAYPGAVKFYERLGFVRNKAKMFSGRERPSMRLDLFAQKVPDWIASPFGE